MSCFIVSDKSINLIVNFLKNVEDSAIDNNDSSWRGDHIPKYVVSDVIEYAVSNFEAYEWRDNSGFLTVGGLQSIGQALVDMNYSAVNYRYETDTIPTVYKYDRIIFDSYRPPLVQVIKTLSCFLYQCNEGCLDTSYFYLELHKMLPNISNILVRNSKEYADAKWE